MVKRETLEINEELPPRVSPLEEELNKELNIHEKPKPGKNPKEESSDSSDDSEDSDSDLEDGEADLKNKKLDENSDEYWIALRKRAGLSN
jgi:hypothetical protein